MNNGIISLKRNLSLRRKNINLRGEITTGNAKEDRTRRGDQQRLQVRKHGIKIRVDLYENSYRKVMFRNENMHRDSWQNSYRDHLMFPRKQVTNHSTYDGW
jgi:hypothetical protein